MRAVLAILMLLPAMFLADPQRPPWPLLRTFTATQSGYSWETGAVNQSISGTITVDASVPGRYEEQGLPDGRSVREVFNYDTVDLTNAGVFSLQPFFSEHVCYIYPLPIGRGYKPIVFDDAEELLWCQQAGLCLTAYNSTTYSGMGKAVDGAPCQLWKHESITMNTTFCVTEQGALLDLAYDYHSGNINQVARTHFANFSTQVDPAVFVVPNRSKCVDLRAPTASGERLVNSNEHIERANREAGGAWTARASPVFDSLTLDAASSRLGLLGGTGFSLPPPPQTHLDALAGIAIPKAFDARDAWGDRCSSVRTIRNQGNCGGCWAFSAAETLADRFCIGVAAQYANLTLSPQWIIDCDKTDNGCGGGLLDDAWRFLVSTGVADEACDPYLYCAHPNSGSCEVGPHPPRPSPGTPHACPTQCPNGSLTTYQAQNAYAVGAPGDVKAIQRELMAHGPVQVGFQVFSDFMTYHNGTYFRTPSAQGPRGGHAVKIVGWGVDSIGVDYWVVANSWSPSWGLQGYFHIRRGTNECGIETTPAAGLPLYPASFVTVQV